jgi:hypothetical protein
MLLTGGVHLLEAQTQTFEDGKGIERDSPFVGQEITTPDVRSFVPFPLHSWDHASEAI